jgi:hypothetical protein
MSEQSKPNYAASLFTFHHVITRGIRVAWEYGDRFGRAGFPDERTRDGYAKYARMLSEVINAHHMVEDEIAFPYFRGKLPDLPVERLSGEHRKMEPLLERMNAAVEKVRTAKTEAEGLNTLGAALEEFEAIWGPHIQIEEQHLELGKIGGMLEADEHLRLIRESTAYSQQHAGPPALMTPFILYNLPAAERAGMVRNMPPEVMERLVPVVWREEWAPMSPFLEGV